MKETAAILHALNITIMPARTLRLCEALGSPEKIFSAKLKELLAAGMETETAEKFLRDRSIINLNDELAKLHEQGISLLAFSDKNYPKLLKEIAHYPRLLYFKGRLDQPDELCVAAVGTRKITGYGRAVTPYLFEPLIDAGVTIVSGLAFGVDSMVQKLAADRGKRTIAILGGGLDNESFYPKEHALLADEILDAGGAIVSEYPPGTPPMKYHFVARNRILSGMCAATVVVECNLKSGSLITARYALEQNRLVYAVPGQIYSEQSAGPNNLIKMGASLITNSAQILSDLNIAARPDEQRAQELFGDSAEESRLLQIINHEPVTINEIIKQSGLPSGRVSAALTFLEMKGRVRNLGAQQYILAR